MCVCAREREGEVDFHTLSGWEGDCVCLRERERVCVCARERKGGDDVQTLA